ncbi:MAG: DUF1217 domain-containing protein [Aestuariivita sp.]|jgi:hypothetical protein|nr:DUF1217 domain-containing protein [Aestuariivita sp.]
MTFQPVVPLAGIAGWQFLQRTYDNQFEAFNQSVVLQRDTDYFRENIQNVLTAETLIADRRLLSVALGAFGLSEDINNKAFLQRILEDGTGSRDALANRLSDERYREFSDGFGFGPNQLIQTILPDFAELIIHRYKTQQFEQAVGNQDETMRIALYAQRELVEIAESTRSQDAQWFSVMGLPPLRTMMEKALGLPASFGQLDIDKQLVVFQEKAREKLGTDRLSELVEPETLERLTNTYLARSQIDSFNISTSGAAIALSLLSQS